MYLNGLPILQFSCCHRVGILLPWQLRVVWNIVTIKTCNLEHGNNNDKQPKWWCPGSSLLQVISNNVTVHDHKEWGCSCLFTMTSHERHVVWNHRPFDCLFNSLSKKHQSLHYWPFARGIHRWLANSPHKGPVTKKKLIFDEVIMFPWEWLTTLWPATVQWW